MARRLTRRALLGALGTAGIVGGTHGRVRATRPEARSGGLQSSPSPPTRAWDRTYGSETHDFAQAVMPTADGDYLFCGTTEYQYGVGKAWLVKLAPDGSSRWDRSYGDATEANDVVELTDGFLFGGVTDTDGPGTAWLVRVGPDGTEQWSKTYAEDRPSRIRGLAATRDGGYLLAGGRGSDGSEAAWLVKVADDGTQRWERTFGGDGDDWANDAIETSDGSYLLAGKRQIDGVGDALLAKVSRDGTEEWVRTYGGTGDDGAASVIETTDGRYRFPGKTRRESGYDGWLVTVAEDGTEQSVWTFGTDLDDSAEAVVETAEGGFLFEGATEVETGGIEDLWLGYVTAEGRVAWTRQYGGPGDDYSLSFTPTHDGGLLLLGNSAPAGTYSAWLVKLDSESLTVATPPTPRSPTATDTDTPAVTSREPAPGSETSSRRATTTASTPGFGVLPTLAGLAGAGYLGWRRNADRGEPAEPPDRSDGS